MLRELHGWGGIQGTVVRPTPFELIFDALPEGIKEFNLVDGKGTRLDASSYWDFTGIKLAH